MYLWRFNDLGFFAKIWRKKKPDGALNVSLIWRNVFHFEHWEVVKRKKDVK